MAGVGCEEENSAMDREDRGENATPTIAEICKRNGVNHTLNSIDKPCIISDVRVPKSDKLVKINGAGKIPVVKPSIPSLRSRSRDLPVSDLWIRKARKVNKTDGHCYEKLGKLGEAVINDTLKTPITADVCSTSCASSPEKTRRSNSQHPHNVSASSSENEGKGTTEIGVTTSSRIGTKTPSCSTEIINKQKNNIKTENETKSPQTSTLCMCSPLSNICSSEYKVNAKIPCHNSNGINFVVRLQAPTTTTSKISSSGWCSLAGCKSQSLDRGTPDTSRSCTPLFGNCSLFPPYGEKTPEKVEVKPMKVECQWRKCGVSLEPADLMDHIKQVHVEGQAGNETFVCLWEKCKVYDKSSCSRSWLDRHILCHSGDKPFKCIVDGCDMRFPSQAGLERHVNSHFNVTQPSSSRSFRSRDDTPTKMWKKKKLKRKRPTLVRSGDFFDSGMMDFIRQDLINFAQKTQMDMISSGSHSVTFHSTVIARRTDESGKPQVLLHYTPEHVLSDCWVTESQTEEMGTHSIPMAELPRDSVLNLDHSLYRTHRFRKHRRK